MSKRASPVAIGIFVLGAGALIVTGLIFFGSHKFFSQSEDFICYFDEAVSGLNVGSAVFVDGANENQVTFLMLGSNGSIRGDQVMHAFSRIDSPNKDNYNAIRAQTELPS